MNLIVSVILNMGGIAVFDGVYYNSRAISLTPLIVGATLSSILIFIKNTCVYKSTRNKSYIRSILMVGIEMGICLMLCLVYQLSNQQINPTTFLAIDLAIYLLFAIVKELHHGWSKFGFNINITAIKYSHLLAA